MEEWVGGDCGGETTAFIEVLAGGEASGGGEMEAALSSETALTPSCSHGFCPVGLVWLRHLHMV